MGRIWAQVLGGAAVTLACLATAVPIVVVHAGGEGVTSIPIGWWTACFALFAAAFVASMWLTDTLPRRTVLRVFAVAAVLAPVLVLTASNAGWTPILLVFVSAMSAYLVPLGVSAALVAAYTAVVAAAAVVAGGSWFEVAMVAGLYLVLQAASVFGVVAQLRESEARRDLAEAHVRLRSASALLAESSRAEERLRIARELHDSIGHQLTVLALELEIASHGDGGEPVERAKELTGRVLGDLRATVGELREEAPDLRQTLEGIVADLPMPLVHLRIGDEVAADRALAAALVRCVQEVVTNAIRHAEAEHLWIDIDAEGGSVVFGARDDGRGAPEVVLGNGLRGMAERLEALGGSVEFSGKGGFRVRAEVPAG
ncbi:MAG TPA: histidine kinase [Glycomyces sp.]|nr:histidine kinase [Glycomyces sp.]